MPRILKFWRQYIATLLVFILLISQTIRVDFFSRVEASQETYRDIVSIFVDADTYKENRSKINRYAEDIQTYLWSTRVSMYILDKDISPAVIATQNEKLYYEGDGEEDTMSRLVGTILIGDLPIPMVDSLKDQFPSIYPYVDFVDKKFLYDEKTGKYIVAQNDSQKIVEPEIWHGVINPAVGREFEPISIEADPTLSGSVDILSDITKIETFLDKTHDFYTQRWVFAPTTMPPRVFYYDGFLEAKSFAIEDLWAYKVYMDSAEEVIYNRFTKHFLKYVIAKVEEEKKKFNQEELAYIDSLGIEGTSNTMFPDEEVDRTPDIQTKPMIMELLKKFYQLINAKSLWDIRGFVHNAGRYNDGTNVRMDQPAISISLMDYSAMNTLRKINNKLEDWVDNVDFAWPAGNTFPVAIFDYLTIREPDPGLNVNRHYDNYIFWSKAWRDIWEVKQCSIARGSDYTAWPYKQWLLVEANSAFDVYTTPDSLKLYEKDGKKKIDCWDDDNNPDTYHVDAYWGKNIITNAETGKWVFKEPSNIRDFYIPIFSLGGMKEINQQWAEVVHADGEVTNADPIDCDIGAGSQYTYMLQSGAIREDKIWPNDEWKSLDDISCKTQQEEFRQPTWDKDVPITRAIGTEFFAHFETTALKEVCSFWKLSFSVAWAGFEWVFWACLPPEVDACYDEFNAASDPTGKVDFAGCFVTASKAYIEELILANATVGESGEITSIRTDSCRNEPWVIFDSDCWGITGANMMQEYYTKIDGWEDYRSACEASALIIDGAVAGKLPLPCMHVGVSTAPAEANEWWQSGGNRNIVFSPPEQNQDWSETSTGFAMTINSTDLSTYEQERFRLLQDTRVFHKSPTDEEIDASEKSNITPSLPIDHDRHFTYMEFSAMNPTSNTIWYPNIFRFNDEEILRKYSWEIVNNLKDPYARQRLEKYGSGAVLITAYRLHLHTLGFDQYAQTAPSMEQPWYIPPEPPCWGWYLVLDGWQTGRYVLNGNWTYSQSWVILWGASFLWTGSILSDNSIVAYGSLFQNNSFLWTGSFLWSGSMSSDGSINGAWTIRFGTASLWTWSLAWVRWTLPSNWCVWDGPLSDDDIASAIRAKRWLSPDVTVKMRKAIETGLTYSREYWSGWVLDVDGLPEAMRDIPALLETITGTLSSPPEILTLSWGYEIAYLGLTDFIPDADDDANNIDTLDGGMSDATLAAYSAATEEYNLWMQQLAAVNISEEDARDSEWITPAPSDSCGPPEWVDLFEWPSAIQCWISSLTPIRIIWEACGANTIWLDAALLANSVFQGGWSAIFHSASVTPPPWTPDAATARTLGNFYTWARLTYHLSRDVMLPWESIQARFVYARDNALLSVPRGSDIRLDVLSIRDKTGNVVDISNLDKYLDVTPGSTSFSEEGTAFLLWAQDNIWTLTLRATLTIPALDGSRMTVQSDIMTVRVTDEYLLAVPTLDGKVTSQISVASSTGFLWDFDVKNLSGTSIEPRYPITLDIYDDVSGGVAYTGITIANSDYTLPTRYTKTVWVYRLEFRDALGRHATNTIAVNAGPIAMASFSPVSSALLKGSNTVVTLRLRDALGNPVSPDLYGVDVMIEGGYFILEDGEKKTNMHIDAIESELSFTVGSDVGWTMRLSATVEDNINTSIDLRVFETARVILSRTWTPEVGGADIPVTVRVEDAEGRPLEGFRSVLNLTTGVGGGTFAPEVVMIDNGISSPLTYTPGRLAGEHRVTASIPGLGSIPDILFTVNPGKPMYISHIEDETYITFSLRDRYNNIAPVTLPGTLETGGKPIQNIVFSGWIYRTEKDAWYMFLNVPWLLDSTITYTDEAWVHTMRGIPKYTAWIKALTQRFNFLEDYNARYTVLAWGTFLRESEDILYNTTPGSGQSLAVTTLLDTPFKRDTVFSLFPGGGFLVWDVADALPEPYLSLEWWYPLLTVRDAVTNGLITQARYRPRSPVLDICTGDACMDSLQKRAHIRLESTMTGITAQDNGDELVLMKWTESLVTVMENGMLYHLPGVVLRVNEKSSQKALFIDIVSWVDTLGHIIYKTDSDVSLEYAQDARLFTGSTIYLEDVGDYLREKTSEEKLADRVTGYRFMKRNLNPTYDDAKNGPESIDGFGLTVDTPGIGWKWTNRTLLSYAGGDTVGEATKWFHTYTMINLWDPVAHNDKRAPGTELDGIDRSIGTQLTSQQASPVRAYTQRDMDNDGYEDIVVLHSDGYVELLLNLADRIRSRGNIAYIPDMTERGFSIGDFQKDGFADIVGVDTEWNFVILANNNRQFTRMKVQVDTGSTLPTWVTQFKVRDMDNDTRDDIVYLSEWGELSILYGTTTQGYFEKKVLDATLGLTLSDTAIKTWGALYASRIPQVSLDALPGTGWLDETLVWNEVYAPYRYTPTEPAVDVDISEPEEFAEFASIYASGTTSPSSSQVSKVKNFVRSEYAEAFNVSVSKKYSLGSGSVLRSWERITVDITIRNTWTSPLTWVEYLDTIPAIFSPENTIKYRVQNWGNSTSGDFVLTSSSDYDTYFKLPDIWAGQNIILSYELDALPTSYGELLVGNYEQGEAWNDAYGDVGFSTATTCGADMLLWRSGPPIPELVPTPPALIPRTYVKWTRSFADMEVPPEILDKIEDADGDGIPDSLGDLTPDSQEEMLSSIEDRKWLLDSMRDKPGNNPTDSETPEGDSVGTDPITTQEIADMAQEIADWLSCGFGWGGCMNFPINWAPLAPGNDPVLFGYPMGDGFRVDEGIPIFAGMTRFDAIYPPYCYRFPMVWPVSPLRYDANWPSNCTISNVGEAWVQAIEYTIEWWERLAEWIASSAQNLVTNGLQDTDNYQTADPEKPNTIIGAGWYIGIDSTTNYLRIYATPTLTLGVGVGICMGTTARRFWGNPPPWLWPLSQVGNCIVVVDSLDMCKDDGSIADGDIRDVVWLGTVNPTWNAGNGSNAPWTTLAWGSCNIVAQTQEEIDTIGITQDIISYARSPDIARLPSLYSQLSKKPPRSNTRSGWPALSLRWATEDGALASVDIEIDLAKPLTADNIIKLKNKRISGFPDFIMDWVSRQTDELVNAFFTPPSLIIIWPTTIGQNNQFDWTMSGLTDSFKTSYEQNSVKSMTAKAGTAYDDEVISRSASNWLQTRTQSSKNSASSDLGKWMQQQQNSFDSIQDGAFKWELGKLADKWKWGLSALRAAYKVIGKLPLITISERTVPIDVPWILPQELDRYARSLDAYAKEINQTLSNNCVGVADTSTCLNQRANAGPLLASINQNLKRIEEYKNFPIKLQKYVTWKQRYLTQVLCYITEVQQMTTGWVKDNSVRFRKWVELYVLIKTIADSWQPILDILQQKDAYCAVCHNERYNAKYWKYKLISLLIPSLPVIQMPRWPDIVLDLSDVRLGVVIAVPNFQFNLKPIRLPNLPSLWLPTAPNVTLWAMELIPPIPELPDLPDLPSIPTIKLPNLPPPPKLPKILSELKVVLDILKLWKLLECYLNKTPFVPEWSVGDIIAQRTERQGTNPLDFIDISLPQISIPTIREIRVSSHVNFEVRSEFITEFARAAVAPLNEFTADLGRGIPKKVGENIDISSPANIEVDLQSSLPAGLTGSIARGIEQLERDKDILLDTDEFATALVSEFESNPELAHLTQGVRDGMRMATVDAEREQNELLSYNDHKYDILKEYIWLQYDETANMQHVIDLLTEEHSTLASVDIERALMVSQDISTRSSALAEKWNKGVTDALNVDDTVRASDTVDVEVSALSKRMKRLAANFGNDATATAEVEASLATGYSPNFRGIYIVTAWGTQTRLFDYTETLQEDNPSTRVDIDKDGDQDYLFLLEGTLFLKRTSTYSPTKIVDTERIVTEIDTEDVSYPTAPDYFNEYVSLPNNVNIAYEPARADESVWRTTFYDRYLEWDKIAQWEHEDSESPQHILEVFKHDPDEIIYEKEVLRSLDRVGNPESFAIEWPRMEVLTGPMEFILSPWRTLYTGDEAVTILYWTWTAEPTIEKRIPAHRGFAIPDIANVSFDRWTLYIVYPSIVPERYTYSDDLIGMPILPGMAVYAGEWEVILLDHMHNDDIVLPVNSFYHAESSIKLGNEYSVQLEYPNGFYQARIENLDTLWTQSAGEVLFTPQASSDSSAPDVDIRDAIRVPVYQEHSILLSDVITDTNPYTVLVDTDTAQDSDNNWVYDDDFRTSSLWLSVTDTTLTLGPYDTIGNRYMMFKVTDEFYNTTYLPVTIQVYSPIPRITESLGTGAVRWTLGDTLEWEPVHLFRVRTGTDIFRLSTWAILTDTGWVFETGEYFTSSGVELTTSWQSVRISELGIPTSLPSGYSTRVVLASVDNPLSIVILDSVGRQLYRQIITLPEDAVFTTNSGATEGVILNPSSWYSTVSASVNDPSISGGSYVIDSANRPVIAIARDGNIYPIASGVTAVLRQRDWYPQLSLRIWETTFVDVLYKFDFFYTLK